MSDVRDPATDQREPIITDEPYIQDLVIQDIEERKQFGIRKYGTALQASNGRDMLLDAYEEILDLTFYLRGELERGDKALEDSLSDAATRVIAVNQVNGWYEEPRSFGDDIALLHSEVTEMLEAYRHWGMRDATEDECKKPGALTHVGDQHLCKPEGVGSEAADVFIRLLDITGRLGIDLAAEFERKLAFNATRGHRHGGKLL